jgi:alpha-glucosidase
VLNGEIGEYISVARKDRHSDNWYLGSMTNEKSRSFTFILSFLEKGASYEAEIYADASGTTWENNPMKVAISKQMVTSETKLPAELGTGGGLAIRFKKM